MTSNPVVHLVLILCVLAIGATSPGAGAAAEPAAADLVVRNARVFTSNAQDPWAEAVAAKDERIVYVGSDAGIEEYIGPDTKVIDAEGQMLTPGFVDNHAHMLWIGALQDVMTSPVEPKSFDELKDMVHRYAAEAADLPFVIVGWRYEWVPGGMPDKQLADSILSDRPLFLWSHDGHTGSVNSLALERMLATNPQALRILGPELDEETGEPTGVLLEFYPFNPLDFFTIKEMGTEVEQKLLDGMARMIGQSLSFGVTTFNDVQIYASFIPFIEKLKTQGGFDKVRVRGSYYINPFVLEEEEEFKADLRGWQEVGERLSDSHLVVGDSVKLYIDGVPANHTAFYFEPYADEPNEYGHPVWTQEDFDRVMEIVDSLGIQACTHGVGDAGINRILNSYEHVRRVNGARDARHRIEHCEYPSAEDQARMAELGIHAVIQPTFVYADEAIEDVLGLERLRRVVPSRSLKEAGVEISYGSDWSAGPLNPVYGLFLAATRMSAQGDFDWSADETVEIEDAIRYYTIGSARALMMEEDIGSLEVGKYADFVLWSEDLLGITSVEFMFTHDMQLGGLDDLVTMTIVGGEVVYQQ